MRESAKLKLTLKLKKGCGGGSNPPPGTSLPGWPKGRGSPDETQILAQVSVFAAERQIDREWTGSIGCGFKSRLCLYVAR